MVLTYDAYNETLEGQKEKESEVQVLKEKYEQDMKSMREEIENKFQQILTTIDTGKLVGVFFSKLWNLWIFSGSGVTIR